MDYERIRTAMQAVDWRWFMDGQMVFPTVEEMRAVVESLSNSAREHPGARISSGGFAALYTNGHLCVTFVLCEIETDETVNQPENALGD